ncbi:four helix bundle protein [Pedobacter changchengzhani]|uniref:Four helix bundle protein n=1 Tax=Pedobacter changchengzhani TaxID=2529274 RepID=A0A4R5MIL3_9SPHI|nr:four helix bundle protein [Pedobacter changchengzhani]TDG35380.1 four helix bundle protein [Pedobacter changchengzhani]
MEKEKKAYTDLDVWKEARILTNEIYNATKLFPKDELFGLTSQMRRIAVSVPSNIAEGCGRNYPKDSIQFFFIARGSIYELETQLYISFDQKYIDEISLKSILLKLEIVRKLLNGFIKYYQQLAK